MKALLDSGATCSTMSEEIAVAIFRYAHKQMEAKKYSAGSRAYPIVRVERLARKPRIGGIAAGAPIEIKYIMVLRTEFVPA